MMARPLNLRNFRGLSISASSAMDVFTIIRAFRDKRDKLFLDEQYRNVAKRAVFYYDISTIDPDNTMLKTRFYPGSFLQIAIAMNQQNCERALTEGCLVRGYSNGKIHFTHCSKIEENVLLEMGAVVDDLPPEFTQTALFTIKLAVASISEKIIMDFLPTIDARVQELTERFDVKAKEIRPLLKSAVSLHDLTFTYMAAKKEGV